MLLPVLAFCCTTTVSIAWEQTGNVELRNATEATGYSNC